MPLLDRYMSRELVGPFLAGVAAFTAILTGTGMLFQLARMAANGIPLAIVCRLFALGLPAFVVLTFPMAMLFSSLMAFGRLSGESEMVAMFASGINLYRMLLPVLAISLVVALATWEFNEAVVPWASSSAVELQRQIGQAPLQSRVLLPVYEHGDVSQLVMAAGFDPVTRRMRDVQFLQFKGGELVFFIHAKQATAYRAKIWDFYDASITEVSARGPVLHQVAHLKANIGSSPDQIQRSSVKPEQMTYRQLTRYIAGQRIQGLAGAPVLENEVNLQRKLALPFTSLVFAAVGAPLGIRPSRRSSGFGLGLGFSILVIFAFYVLTSYLTVIGGQGLLDPVFAAWLPNIITLAVGIVLLARAPK